MIYYQKQGYGYLAEHSHFLSGRLKVKLYLHRKALSSQVPCGIPNAECCWHAGGIHLRRAQGSSWLSDLKQHCITEIGSLLDVQVHKNIQVPWTGARGLNSQVMYGPGSHESLAILVPVALSQFSHEGFSRKASQTLSPHYSYGLLIAVYHCAVLCWVLQSEDVCARCHWYCSFIARN